MKPEISDLIGEACNAESDTPEILDREPFPVLKNRPCFHTIDQAQTIDGKLLRCGLYWCSLTKGRNPQPLDVWVSNPLHIMAQGADSGGGSYSRLLRFLNSQGAWLEFLAPMHLLAGDGSELLAALLDRGFQYDQPQRGHLLRHIMQSKPAKTLRTALRTGWQADGVFVLPDSQAVGIDAENVRLLHPPTTDFGGVSGTLGEWREHIARYAANNPMLTLALSAAFAPPLLCPLELENGGLHFIGDSSVGKTTALAAAVSAWGAPSYRRSWRTTANGLEGVAASVNDCLLALDEVSECSPKEISGTLYMLGNGAGKTRANRHGDAREAKRWRCFVLSTGERSTAAAMEEGNLKAKAGQTLRLLDIPSARRFGLFDDLHGFPDGAALANHIKSNAAQYYGTAARVYIERLICADFDDLRQEYQAMQAQLTPKGADGQEARAAGRFALLALAGELATGYGITGWNPGDATAAATEGFRLWRDTRGTGRSETRQILDQVRSFLERHGDSRFSNVEDDAPHLIRDRAGWWTATPEGRQYLFTGDGLKEATKGFDFSRALAALRESGTLVRGRLTKVIGGRRVNVYPIVPDRLDPLSAAEQQERNPVPE